MTNYWHLAFSCAFLTLLSTTVTAADEEIPAEYRPAIERAEYLGTALYVHDVAAARASDELTKRRVFKKDKRVQGWITEIVEGGDVVVTFAGEDGGAAMALYRVRVPPEGRTATYEALVPAQPLSVSERALFAARTVATAEFSKRKEICSTMYNTVVLPIQRPGDPFILVYLLAATTKPDVLVAGGHVRYEVSPDGAHIEGERTFTKSCLELPLAPPKKDHKLASLMMTHLLDPTPTEVHVFLSRLHDMRLAIGAVESGILWEVLGSEIGFVTRRESP